MYDNGETYKLYPIRRRTWIWLWVALLAIGLVPGLFIPSSINYFLTALTYCAVWGTPLWITALTLWSRNRYGRTVIDQQNLRYGRSVVALADILDVQIADNNHEDLSDQLTLFGITTIPGVRLADDINERYSVMGGAWGVPLGSSAVVLRTSRHAKLLVMPIPHRHVTEVAMILRQRSARWRAPQFGKDSAAHVRPLGLSNQ